MAAARPHFSPLAASAAADEAAFAVFRLLLPPSFSDAATMRLYAAVNPLRRRTAALQVRVEPLDASSGRVVAAVLGPTAPVRRVKAYSSGEPLALSPAQEALVAVIDAGGALHGADEDGGHGFPPGCVTCLLLVEAARLEAAVGRGDLGRIALEAGADVRVAQWEEGAPPPGGQPPEEVVEITGDRTAVRKALVALSSYLQGDLPAGSMTSSVDKEGSTLPWASSEVPESNMGTLCSEVSTERAHSSVPQIDFPGTTGDVQSKGLQQISLRLLLPTNLAGGLIGKKGSIIKGIEDETGACVDVGVPLSGCTERVITICALESPESECHIVQSALLLIFDRMMEIESKARSTFDKAYQSLARALVLKSQLGCLVGLGGSVIKEMVNATGARIQILDDTDVPACASQFELVLQITGELMNVRDALCLVSWKLRNHVFSSNRTDCNNGYIPSSDITGPKKPDNGNGVGINNPNNDMRKTTELNDIVTNNLNYGITFPEENNPVRGVEHATITRITYETAVSGSILNLVYGDNGINLAKLTEINGAEIAVYDPPSEGSEAVIVVSGPPDQAQAAQRLLVELILQGQ